MLSLTMALESYVNAQRGVTWKLESWIMHLSQMSFLLSTGLVFHHLLDIAKKKWLSYVVGRKHLTPITKNFSDASFQIHDWFKLNFMGLWLVVLQGLAGFCLPCLIFPFWLTIREGTIDCFADRTCQNNFSLYYLSLMDLVSSFFNSIQKTNSWNFQLCCTPRFGFRRGQEGLNICEAIGYTLPIVLFSSIPVAMAVRLWNSSKLDLSQSSGSNPKSKVKSGRASSNARHGGVLKGRSPKNTVDSDGGGTTFRKWGSSPLSPFVVMSLQLINSLNPLPDDVTPGS